MKRRKMIDGFRDFPLQEVRVEDGETDDPIITGYAAVFEQWSLDLGGFREIIHKGAFSKTLKDGADVRSLFNHDSNIVLGRTTANTLKVEEDEKGLRVEIKPPKTRTVEDLVLTPMRRGDINQMSFGFRTVKDVWGKDETGHFRELQEARLYEVSPVTFPAYPQTSVQVRSVLEDSGIDYEALADVLVRSHQGLELHEADEELLRSSIAILTGCLPAEPGQELHSDDSEKEELQVRFGLLARRIQVAKSK